MRCPRQVSETFYSLYFISILPLVVRLSGYTIFPTNTIYGVTSPFMFMNEIEFCSNFYRYPLPSRSVTYVCKLFCYLCVYVQQQLSLAYNNFCIFPFSSSLFFLL